MLKVDLGGQVDESFPKLDDATLRKLYRLASKQAVRGFAFEGLQQMNANRNGGIETILNWSASVM